MHERGIVAGQVDGGQGGRLRVAAAILAALTGGANLLIATDQIGYLDIALTEAIEDLRRPGTRAKRRVSLG